MIALIARMKVKDGKEEDFERAMAELTLKVRSEEPGCHYYQLCRGRAGDYLMMERYSDEAALAAHRETPHFKAAGATLGPCLAGRPEVEVFEEVE